MVNTLEDCKSFAPNKRVCKLPVYNVNTRPTCETSILTSTSTTVPEICEVVTFSANINTFQALQTNRWIYIVRHKTSYTLECDSTTTHGDITGAGIISLEPGCVFFTALTTLSAEDIETVNITHPIVNVDIETICFPGELDLKETKLIPIRINNVPLDSLNTVKEEIKIHTKLLQEKESSFLKQHSSKLSILNIFIGLFLLLLLLMKCCNYNPFKLLRGRRSTTHRDGCIQIFHNCFDRSRRQQHIEIPMASLNTTTSCVTEDEDEDTEISSQKSGKPAQSLF
ncbi:baculovirus F protein domain-containing protein [Phthorimaea operculella]|nr:baculovirus F protein domain-containing protein [Phthorimaea operculella]